MPVSTTSAAFHIAPVVIKTFFQHTKRKGAEFREPKATQRAWDDIFYDEGFHIVKAFIELGTKNTVESLQAFTNTHVPAPYWVAVVPVRVPLSSCNKAADALVEWFGPEELWHVVGGERWWQVRGLGWVDAEWITEKDYLKDVAIPEDVERTEEEKTVLRMEHLDRVMLYVHGGAFFWGSINTHRYQVIRYARKIKGRAFAVNYQKAPQYPWPCPLQDVLAAYFYLTNPPPGAAHKPVPPSKLVFAGDSAGATLCLSALTVLRDLGLPQPAGAVLISPWVDLTHSFPSVMTNAATDIIPPHGFIHKPSTTWPVHPKPEGGYTRVLPTKTKPPPQPGHADKLKPNAQEATTQINQRLQQSQERGEPVPHAAELRDDPEAIPSQEEMQSQDDDNAPDKDASPPQGPPNGNGDGDAAQDGQSDLDLDVAIDFFEPKPPKVLMEDPKATPLELCAQIQLYATTEQLSHPLVSPALQSSLGNLCPLYILAGDGECLRDEIIYLSHKAANPKDYPARQGILRDGRRQKENAEKFQTPTRVHLQVFDDMCHVLTVFTFTQPGKYAYRSIAQFVKHVIDNPDEHLQRNVFPELHRPSMPLPEADTSDSGRKHPTRTKSSQPNKDDIKLYHANAAQVEREVHSGEAQKAESSSSSSGEDISSVFLIRERVDPCGKVRPMEPMEDIEALHVPLGEIGLIKERPVRRWLEGQEAWDKKFKRSAEQVIKKRKRCEAKWERLLENAKQQGLYSGSSSTTESPVGTIEPERRWGPLDLQDEKPPPSAIAGRKDTREAVALLKNAIYHSAPATHRYVPKMKTMDVIRAALDPHDHATKVPPQSASEQQIHKKFVSIPHGLRMWQYIVDVFMRKSTQKVAEEKARASSTLRSTKKKLSPSRHESDPAPQEN